ncbi:MAG TPA: RCC1 domain-containing protein, partial [Solirubrobacteraceae bacterium]|nr:RCC1 domain-containing protein [Solirubrobacteraceae bacterium]
MALLCIAAALLADVAAAASAQAAGPVVGWGNGGNGELGTGSQPIESDVPVAASLPAGVTVKSIAAGELDSYAVLSNGKVMAWGEGALGNGKSATEESTSPVEVEGLSGVTAMSAEGNHSLAL